MLGNKTFFGGNCDQGILHEGQHLLNQCEKMSAKVMYKINIGQLIKTSFSHGTSITSVGYLNNNQHLSFPDSFKKCHYWKIFCPAQVDALLKMLLAIIYLSLVHPHIQIQQLQHNIQTPQNLFDPPCHVYYMNHVSFKISRVGLKSLVLFSFCSCTGELTDCSKRN